MAGIGPISQDWEPVVIRKKAPNAAAKKDEKAVNAARRAGADIETVKKCPYFPSLSIPSALKSLCRREIHVSVKFPLFPLEEPFLSYDN